MERLKGLARDKRVILGLAAAVLLIKAVIAVPTWDDEVWSSHVVGPQPYYNDYVGLQMPILKPMVTVQLPARLVHYPWNFLYVSLLKTALIVAAAWLTYRVALRYVGRDAATVAGALTLFLLAVHVWTVPARPEAWLLTVLLAVVYLCDTWRLTGRAVYLAAACAIAGVLGLPMHTNASIIYIYLALFALWQRRRLTRRDWVAGVGALTVSSLAGLAILLLPQPGALFDLLGAYEGRAENIPVVREFERWSRYATSIAFEPLFPMSVVFGATGIVAIATLRPGWAGVRGFARRYAGLLLIALAAFIGLGLLPSAPWTQYAVFYFPTLTVLAALAYGYRPATGRGAVACWFAVVVATGALAIGLRVLWGVGVGLLTLTMLAYCTFLAAILCAAWLTRRRELLACAVVVAVLCSFALSAERYLSYQYEEREYRRLAQVHQVDVIYADRLAWAFTGSPHNRSLSALGRDPAEIERGLVFLYTGGIDVDPDGRTDLASIAPPSCDVKEVARLDKRALPLAGALSRSESVVWLVECGEEERSGGS